MRCVKGPWADPEIMRVLERHPIERIMTPEGAKLLSLEREQARRAKEEAAAAVAVPEAPSAAVGGVAAAPAAAGAAASAPAPPPPAPPADGTVAPPAVPDVPKPASIEKPASAAPVETTGAALVRAPATGQPAAVAAAAAEAAAAVAPPLAAAAVLAVPEAAPSPAPAVEKPAAAALEAAPSPAPAAEKPAAAALEAALEAAPCHDPADEKLTAAVTEAAPGPAPAAEKLVAAALEAAPCPAPAAEKPAVTAGPVSLADRPGAERPAELMTSQSLAPTEATLPASGATAGVGAPADALAAAEHAAASAPAVGPAATPECAPSPVAATTSLPDEGLAVPAPPDAVAAAKIAADAISPDGDLIKPAPPTAAIVDATVPDHGLVERPPTTAADVGDEVASPATVPTIARATDPEGAAESPPTLPPLPPPASPPVADSEGPAEAPLPLHPQDAAPEAHLVEPARMPEAAPDLAEPSDVRGLPFEPPARPVARPADGAGLAIDVPQAPTAAQPVREPKPQAGAPEAAQEAAPATAAAAPEAAPSPASAAGKPAAAAPEGPKQAVPDAEEVSEAELEAACLWEECRQHEAFHKKSLARWVEDSNQLVSEIGQHVIERAQPYYDALTLWQQTHDERIRLLTDFDLIESECQKAALNLEMAELAFGAFTQGKMRDDFTDHEWSRLAPVDDEVLAAVAGDPKLMRQMRVSCLGDRVARLQRQRDARREELVTRVREAEGAQRHFEAAQEEHQNCSRWCSVIRAEPFYKKRQVHEEIIEAQLSVLAKAEGRLQQARDRVAWLREARSSAGAGAAPEETPPLGVPAQPSRESVYQQASEISLSSFEIAGAEPREEDFESCHSAASDVASDAGDC